MAKPIAEGLARVFKAGPGCVWVRLRSIPAGSYAENGPAGTEALYPVFVTVIHADLPSPEALALESAAIADAVGHCLHRDAQQVHVEFAPAGRGRVAFGGKLLL